MGFLDSILGSLGNVNAGNVLSSTLPTVAAVAGQYYLNRGQNQGAITPYQQAQLDLEKNKQAFDQWRIMQALQKGEGGGSGGGGGGAAAAALAYQRQRDAEQFAQDNYKQLAENSLLGGKQVGDGYSQLAQLISRNIAR